MVEPLESRQLLSVATLNFNLPAEIANQGVQIGLYSNKDGLYLGSNTKTGELEFLEISDIAGDTLSLLPLTDGQKKYDGTYSCSITIPDLPAGTPNFRSGELFIFVGTVNNPLTITNNQIAGATPTNDPATGAKSDCFAQIELTYLGSGVAPGLDIDSSAVDSTGLPFTIVYSNDCGISYPLNELGITLDEKDLNENLIANFSEGGTYAEYSDFVQCATYDQQADPSSTNVVAPQDILAAESTPPQLNTPTYGTDGYLSADCDYYYCITAFSDNTIDGSDSLQGETLPSSNVLASLPAGKNSVTLTWNQYYDPNTAGYNIYRYSTTNGAAPDDSTVYSLIAHLYGADTTTFTDNGSIEQTQQTSVDTARNYGFNPLSEYYTSEIIAFFEHYKTHTFSIERNGVLWEGNTVTYAPATSWNTAGESYTVLQLTAYNSTVEQIPNGSVVNIYEPLFSTNYISTGTEEYPSMPSWLQTLVNPYTSASQMVFACNGVFASNSADPDVTSNGVLATALGAIENSIVSAFNRGIVSNHHIQPDNWAAFPQILNAPTVSGTASSGSTPEQFCYAVVAENIYGETTPSIVVGATFVTEQQTATLSWTNGATASPALHYLVYRGTTPDNLGLIATLDGNTTFYVDNGTGETGAAPTYQYFAEKSTSNWYAAFVQTNSTLDPASGISINGLSYGFPYSDQGGLSTNVYILQKYLPTDITINIGTKSGPTFYTQTLNDAEAGESYSQTLTVTGSGTNATFAVTAGVLPSWLSLDTDTGVLSGTAPETLGASEPFTITATNTAGSIDRTFTVTVDQDVSAPLTVIGEESGQVTIGATDVGSNFTMYLQVTGGTGPYTMSPPAAAAGVTFTSITQSNGLFTIKGNTTTAVGDVPQKIGFDVTITDSNSKSASVTMYLQINPVLEITTRILPNPISGEYYYQRLNANNSTTDSVTFSISSGALPQGLQLTPWGVVCGTTTDASESTFYVMATDSSGVQQTKPYTIQAVEAPGAITFQTNPLPDAVPGEEYQGAQISATGGSGTLTYAIVNSSLPNGLLLSSAGQITGTLAAQTSGVYAFTVRAIDALGNCAYQGFQLNVVGLTASDQNLSDQAETLVLNGYGFGTTGVPLVQSVKINGTSFDFTVNSTTQLTVNLDQPLAVGTATGVVTIGGMQYSASVANVEGLTPPTIVSSTNELNANLTTLVILGTNFDSAPQGTNYVTLSSGTVQSVTASAAGELIVSVSGPLDPGILYATVTTDGQATAATAVGVVIDDNSPVLYGSVNDLLDNLTTLVLYGFNFDATTNTVMLSSAAGATPWYTGTASVNADCTQLTITGLNLTGHDGEVYAQVVRADKSATLATQIAIVQASSVGVTVQPQLGTNFWSNGTTLVVNGRGFKSSSSVTLQGYNTSTGEWDPISCNVDCVTPNQFMLTGLPSLAAYSSLQITVDGQTGTVVPAIVNAGTAPVIESNSTSISGSVSTLTIDIAEGGQLDVNGMYYVRLYTEVNGTMVELTPAAIASTGTQMGVQNVSVTDSQITVTLAGPLPIGDIYASVIMDGVYIGNPAEPETPIQVGTVTTLGPSLTASTTLYAPDTTVLTIQGSGFSTTGLNTVLLYTGESFEEQLPANAVASVVANSSTQLTVVLNKSVTLPAGPLGARVFVLGQAVDSPVQVATVDEAAPTIVFCSTKLAAETGPDASSKTDISSGSFVIYGTNFSNNSSVTLSTVAGPLDEDYVLSVTPNEAGTQLIVKLSYTEDLPADVQLYATVTNSSATETLTSNTVQVAKVVNRKHLPSISANSNNLSANITKLVIEGTYFDATGGGVNEVTLSSGQVTDVTVSEDIETKTYTLNVTLTGPLSEGYLTAQVTVDGLQSQWQVVGTVTAPGTPIITSSDTHILTTANSLTINGSGFKTGVGDTNIVKLYSGLTLINTYTVQTQSETSLTVPLTPSANPLPLGTIDATVTVNGVSSVSTQVADVVNPPTIAVSTAAWSVGNLTLTINGTGFDPTDTNDQVLLSSGSGYVQSASSTQIVVAITDIPTAGVLSAQVIADGFSSAWAIVATALPVVDTNTAPMSASAKTMTITGKGFDTIAANDHVVLSSGTATVLTATATELTLKINSAPNLGPLTATVCVDQEKVSAVVATVTSGPTIGSVVTAVNQAQPEITWNLTDSDGIASTALTVDGTSISTIYGPYGTKYNANYSASIGKQTGGSHTFTITATDVNGAMSTYNGSFNVGSPTISSVVTAVNQAQPEITWNLTDSYGIASTAIIVDGRSISTINGPYGTKYNANYSASIGKQTGGSHTFTITAYNVNGVKSTYNGTFNVDSPAIGKVVAAVNQAQPEITWNLTDSYGIASTAISVDGTSISTIGGPYGTKYNANYSASIGKQSSGGHTFTITAYNVNGVKSTYNGTFNVITTASVSTIGRVVTAVNRAKPEITWNLTNSDGIASTAITVDGRSISTVYGPYGTKYNANYSASIGTMSIGSHSYTITATDVNGVKNMYSGNFTVTVAASVPSIGSVVVAAAAAKPVITWNVADSDGIGSTSITVDGKSISTIYGPYGTKYDANYSVPIATLSSGSHAYTITATDVNGVKNTYSGNFSVAELTAAAITSLLGDGDILLDKYGVHLS